jgi:maleate isomerase
MQTTGIDEGHRARLGVVVPGINTVVEPWFAKAVPTGVSVHASRMLLAPALSPQSVIDMDRAEGLQAVRQIASCRPSSIAYCCTASSVVQGQAYDERLRTEIAHASGAKATTATHAILSALAVFGARRVAIVSPYTDEVDALEHHFFADAGLDVVGSANLGIGDTFALATPDEATLIDLARRGWRPDADALIMTCLNTRSHFVAEAMEREIGKPVVTSTTATLWHALRLAGVTDPVPGYGALLAAH